MKTLSFGAFVYLEKRLDLSRQLIRATCIKEGAKDLKECGGESSGATENNNSLDKVTSQGTSGR